MSILISILNDARLSDQSLSDYFIIDFVLYLDFNPSPYFRRGRYLLISLTSCLRGVSLMPSTWRNPTERSPITEILIPRKDRNSLYKFWIV